MTARHIDPNWPTAASWIGGAHRDDPVGTMGLLGVPLCKGSITRGRCDLAPQEIRNALTKFSTYDLCAGLDLRDLAVADFGDLDIAAAMPGDATPQIVEAVADIMSKVDLLTILGGDNSVTRPAFRGMCDSLSDCALLTLDAHLDLRDLDPGPMNGNPVRGLLEDGLPGTHIVQIGIQPFANSAEYAKVAQESGIEVVDIRQTRARGITNVTSQALAKLARLAQRIYVDIDMDVLDRAFAPATPGSRPGGLFPYELLEMARVCGANPRVTVIDLVEVDPSKDIGATTILATASCLLGVASGLRTRWGGP